MAESKSNFRSWTGLNVLVVAPTPTHPQDHGNRKRIYEVCTTLKRRGARIEFVHYPSEHDWRHEWPLQRENEMRATWDAYHLVAPSRELHQAAKEQDHGIDEWADPGLSAFVAWACRVRCYDAILVNYTWLSFCLDAAPKDIFKICDTHDVFSARRELLEANGLGAEFFHTTRDDERRGLMRADLVWAIKPSEMAYFEDDLGLPNCLTMLHVDPERGWWRGAPSTDGWLRAGVIGARNSINRQNLEQFLRTALPIFETYMAPVKVVIAGGVSTDFEGWSHPNIEVIGRVAEVEDFYRSVDVVIAPMRFSTGLKIKVSEALASGAPLVAHAHAVEGYPTREPLHLLKSFEDIARTLASFAFERAPLAELAARSHEVCAEIGRCVSEAFDATREQIRARSAASILVVAPAEALDPGSLLHDHLLQALDYLRFLAQPALYVSGPPPKTMSFDLLARFEMRRQVFADPQLAAALGAKAPEFMTPVPLAELLEIRGYRRAYIMADVSQSLTGTGALVQVVVRVDAVRLAGGDPVALVEKFKSKIEIILLGAEPRQLLPWQDDPGVAELIYAPFRRNGGFESLVRREAGPTPRPLLVLVRGREPLAQPVLDLAATLGWEGEALDLADAPVYDVVLGRGGGKGLDPLARFAERRLVVDLIEGDDLAEVLDEAAMRLGIPRLRLQRGMVALGLHGFAPADRPTSLARLFRAVAECVGSPQAWERHRTLAWEQVATRYGKDAGWTVLWASIKSRE